MIKKTEEDLMTILEEMKKLMGPDEDSHNKADGLLLDLIDVLCTPSKKRIVTEIKDAYMELEKWYA